MPLTRRSTWPGCYGNFSKATQLTAGSTPYGIVVADINGDQRPDLLVGNLNSQNVSVFVALADGGYAPATYSTGGGSHPGYLAVGDFNADGFPDSGHRQWQSTEQRDRPAQQHRRRILD